MTDTPHTTVQLMGLDELIKEIKSRLPMCPHDSEMFGKWHGLMEAIKCIENNRASLELGVRSKLRFVKNPGSSHYYLSSASNPEYSACNALLMLSESECESLAEALDIPAEFR